MEPTMKKSILVLPIVLVSLSAWAASISDLSNAWKKHATVKSENKAAFTTVYAGEDVSKTAGVYG